MATAGYLNKFNNKKQNDTKSIVSQQSSKKSNTTECKTKEDLLIKMQQNEEKHRLLMMENNKRRKEQEKKLKQQEEEKNKQTAATLEQRKKTKEQAYINYLRNNTKQILADYQPRQTDYPKPNPKPIVEKKVQTNYNNFEALDLEVSQVAKKKLPQEFQKQWEDFEVMRKSELLDSLDLSTAQKNKQPPKKNELQTILGLPEENSDDEEDLWKNTMKGGQLAKQQTSKPPLSKPMQWAEQAITQADDVLSKMSQKQDREKKETIQKQEPPKQKQNSTSVPKKNTQNKEQLKILQQKEQQLLAQQMQIQQQTNIEPQQQQRKPQSNIRITSKQVQRHPSSVQDEQNHIQEFLKEDLQNVNDLEMQLQMELKNLNKENKQKMENIQEKYGVRNLHSSNQVNRIVFVENQQPIKSVEDQIEASLLKLDLMLQQPSQRPLEQVQIQQQPQQQQKVQQQPQQQVQQQPQQITQQMNQQQYQQLLEQQVQLQKQLLLAQQQIQMMQQQQPSPMLQQQNQIQQQINQMQQLQQQQQQYQQSYQQMQQQQTIQQQQNQTSNTDFPRFPSYVLHQDHHSFVQTFTNIPNQKSEQKGINQKPRNVITNDNQSLSVVSSQQNDKYSFDLDFGVKGPSYAQQAMKKQTQKQSQVKQQVPIEEEEEQEDGKIEVREDLRNLLFD